MKKFISTLLALLLTLSCTAALAAPGDEIIVNTTELAQTSMRGMARLGDYVYVAVYNEDVMYRWSAEGGIEELKVAEGLFASDDGYVYSTAFVSDGENLYMLCTYSISDEDSTSVDSVKLHRLDLSGEEVTFADSVEMDWDDMIEYYDNYEYARDPNCSFITEGKLVFCTYGDGGEGLVGVYDILDGDGELYEMPADCSAVCAYKDGKVLVQTSSYEDSSATLYAMDMETGELEKALDMPYDNEVARGFAYNPDNDTFYYVIRGELFSVTGLDPASTVAVATVNINGWSNFASFMLPDGRYATTDGSRIIARSTDPSQRNATKITVSTSYITALENAYYDFTAAHGDVDVVISNNNTTDVITAMMNRDSTIDVYCLSASDGAFSALYSRGFLAELSGSEKLSAFGGGVYDGIKSSIYNANGELVALPVELYSDAWSFNPKALAEIGLTEDDAPKSWEEFIAFLPTLPALLEGHDNVSVFATYYTQRDMRMTLFYGLFNAYILYMQSDPSAVQSFDNAQLAAMFDAIYSMDYAAFGLSEEYEDDGWFGSSGDKMTLFQDYGNVSPNVYSLTSGFTTMPMSVFEGGNPYISVGLYVAFVNPYSENRELAIEYLESTLGKVPLETCIALSNDYNEPVLNEYYEESLQSYTEWIETVEAEMEKCTDEDELAQWQEQLTSAQENYEDFKTNHMYNVSEESMAYYRTFTGYFAVNREFVLYSEDNYQEVYEMITKFQEGTIGASEMLKGIDKKYQMIILEDM